MLSVEETSMRDRCLATLKAVLLKTPAGMPAKGNRRRSVGDSWAGVGDLHLTRMLPVTLFFIASAALGQMRAPPLPGPWPGLNYINYRVPGVPWSIHVVQVDRSRAEYRIHSVHAQQTALGLSTLSATIASMQPTIGLPVAAINGDYFGADRGPEGPTVVQGQRLDTPLTIAFNPSHYRRTTLALSRSGTAAISHLNPIASLGPNVYRDLLFNAISGGPASSSRSAPAEARW